MTETSNAPEITSEISLGKAEKVPSFYIKIIYIYCKKVWWNEKKLYIYTIIITNNMKSELHKKIDALIQAGKIYEYSNRCWFTCYMTWTKLRKDEKLRTKIVEGKHVDNGLHYWLEIDNKEVCDVHYKLVEQDLDFEFDWQGNFVDNIYTKHKSIDPYKLKIDKENYENKPAYNWLGREKFAKVWDLT